MPSKPRTYIYTDFVSDNDATKILKNRFPRGENSQKNLIFLNITRARQL